MHEECVYALSLKQYPMEGISVPMVKGPPKRQITQQACVVLERSLKVDS